MDRDKVFGYRTTGEWRRLVPSVVFLVACAVIAIVADLLFLGILFTASAPLIAFVAGYLMRADEVARARRPHLPFLYVKGDESHR